MGCPTSPATTRYTARRDSPSSVTELDGLLISLPPSGSMPGQRLVPLWLRITTLVSDRLPAVAGTYVVGGADE